MGYIITKKQANAVYSAWKNGEVEADKQLIDKMYFYADNADFYWDKYTINMNYHIREAVEYVIRKRFSRAQQHIANFAYWVELKEKNDAKQARYMAEAAAWKAKKGAVA